jgi:hypothetical protein
LTTPNVVAACRLRSPAFCVVAFLSSVLFSGVLTAFCVILIIDPDADKSHRLENAVELAFALGWLCLSINQANTFIGYSFLIFAEGFTQRRRQAEGEIVPWSQVVTLLPRPLLQRLDLRGAHGRLLATVEYQIDGLERAFVEIVKRANPPAPHLPFTLRRGWSFTRVVIAAILAGGAVMTLRLARPQPLHALELGLTIAALAFCWFSNHRQALRRVTMYPDGLVIHHGPEKYTIPWHDVIHISFDSRSGGANTYMNASVVFRDGSTESIVPSGRERDVVRAYLAAQAAYRRVTAPRATRAEDWQP